MIPKSWHKHTAESFDSSLMVSIWLSSLTSSSTAVNDKHTTSFEIVFIGVAIAPNWRMKSAQETVQKCSYMPHNLSSEKQLTTMADLHKYVTYLGLGHGLKLWQLSMENVWGFQMYVDPSVCYMEGLIFSMHSPLFFSIFSIYMKRWYICKWIQCSYWHTSHGVIWLEATDGSADDVSHLENS